MTFAIRADSLVVEELFEALTESDWRHLVLVTHSLLFSREDVAGEWEQAGYVALASVRQKQLELLQVLFLYRAWQFSNLRCRLLLLACSSLLH